MRQPTEGKRTDVAALIGEWQRGAISWGEFRARTDLTPRGYEILDPITRMTPGEEVGRLVAAAVNTSY
jgi:hypothetical protein